MRTKRTSVAILLALSVSVVGCSDDKRGDDSIPTTTTSTAPADPAVDQATGSPPTLKLTELATVNEPTAMAQRDGDDGIFIAERKGVVRLLRGGSNEAVTALDIQDRVGSSGSEQGLLGLAFAPKSANLYANYTDKSGDTHIVEYGLTPDGLVDVNTQRELLLVDQPFPNHNGGQLAFGPDGNLYIGLGDGGGAGDPQKNAQNLSVLLGKILRISVKPSTGLPYTIPFDNPYTKQAGARGEIWAYGLRNPWRFSFDMQGKNLWIGDVGQNSWEEINRVAHDEKARGGQNYGWPMREATHKYTGDKPKDGIDPVYEYKLHDGGTCSVTGGYVYRGGAIPGLIGRYLFADYCKGEVMTLTQEGDALRSAPTNLKVANLASFGQDKGGELYVLSLEGKISRIDRAG